MKDVIFIALITIFSFSVKLFMSSKTPYLNDWDESFHALVGKNMASDNTYLTPTLYKSPILKYDKENWAKSNIWLHKQPLTAWIIAISIEVFGANELAVRLPSLLFTSISIILIYFIGQKIFDRLVGLWSSGLFAIHGLTNLLATGRIPTDHVDVYFMFFIFLASAFIFLPEKDNLKYQSLVGILIGMAVLVKWLPAYTILIVYIIYRYDSENPISTVKSSMIVILLSIVIWLPWQIYSYTYFPEVFEASQKHNWEHITQSLGENENGPLFFLVKSIHIFGELWVFCLFYLTFRIIKTNSHLNRNLSLIVWIIVPVVFFSFVSTKMQAYTYFTIPAVLMVSSFLICDIQKFFNSSRYVRAVIVLILLLSPVIRFVESLQLYSILSRPLFKHTIIEDVSNNTNTVIFGSNSPINDMFYLDIKASYEVIPDGYYLDSIREMYNVIIVEFTAQ